MDSPAAIKILSALGHDARLAVFRLLARRAPDALRPTEIAAVCGLKPNTLSAHLSRLSEAGLVTARRDGTALYYSLDRAIVAAFTGYLLNDCCRSRPDLCLPATPVKLARPFKVLFLCTGNSARSILAEAVLRAVGPDRFEAYSAGTHPSGQVNPQVVKLLARAGTATAPLRSKDLSEMQGPDAPEFDFVFTVCDHAANEECPAWPGQPVSAHWGLPDPAAVTGSDADIALAFAAAYRTLNTRIKAFAALPLETLDRLSLQSHVDRIGQTTTQEETPC